MDEPRRTNGPDYQRGRHDAHVDARIENLEARYREVSTLTARLAEAIDGLEETLSQMRAEERQRDAVRAEHEATANSVVLAAQEASDRTLSTRQFYLGLAGFAVAMLSLAAGVLGAVGQL